MSCIFCEIVKGDIPSYKVWEDELTFALLDIHPINEGHVLVIPKKHEPDFHKLDDASYIALMQSVKKVSKMVEKNISPKRVGIMAMGWDVPHAHIHVVPMNDYHDITSKKLLDGTILQPSKDELGKIQEKITQ